MVVHKDSLDETVLNQLKSVFQTVINVNDTNLKQNELLLFSKLNKQIFKYNLKIDCRNSKTAKNISHV